MTPKHRHIDDDDSSKPAAAKHRRKDEPVSDRVSIVAYLVSALKSSRILQIGILAMMLALAVAMVRGDVSFFGIEIHNTKTTHRPLPPTDEPKEMK